MKRETISKSSVIEWAYMIMSNHERQACVCHWSSAGVCGVSGVSWGFGTNAAPTCAADWWV